MGSWAARAQWTSTMHLRRLAPQEAALHRDIRLRALRDAPDSFGETFADAAARPLSYWEELTHSVTRPHGAVMFLACEGEQVLGSVYGTLDRERSDGARVGGTWVDPAARGHGVGQALLQEVFSWARARGFRRLGLWAPPHRAAAIALYTRAGFRETGDRRPLPTDPSLSVLAMEVVL
jgi:GNAT superfamily N-acetyltransferase